MSNQAEPEQDVEEDEVCDVCCEGYSDASNALIFCDGCDLPVHQACYGVAEIPTGEWLCDPCAASSRTALSAGGKKQRKEKAPACALCPVAGGALKPTVEGGWAHVVCALWVPEMSFVDVDSMSPVAGCASVPKSRRGLTCRVCKEKNCGAGIQCADAKVVYC